mgnify:CR=1 FL=1
MPDEIAETYVPPSDPYRKEIADELWDSAQALAALRGRIISQAPTGTDDQPRKPNELDQAAFNRLVSAAGHIGKAIHHLGGKTPSSI